MYNVYTPGTRGTSTHKIYFNMWPNRLKNIFEKKKYINTRGYP